MRLGYQHRRLQESKPGQAYDQYHGVTQCRGADADTAGMPMERWNYGAAVGDDGIVGDGAAFPASQRPCPTVDAAIVP